MQSDFIGIAEQSYIGMLLCLERVLEMKPLFTIVTVCYNCANSIEKTIQSVLMQRCKDYEYLIIDGASTDGTIDIVNSYLAKFEGRMRLFSEKDGGWYDAMNKGIRLSDGRFIVFINSDDYFSTEALQIVADFIEYHQICSNSIIYGDSTNMYSNINGDLLYRRISAPKHIDANNSNLKNGMCGIRHQSMFTGREVFKGIGELDLQYRLHADWDFMIKSLKAGVPYYYVEENLSFYSMYGQSTRATYEERHRVRRDNQLYNGVDWNYFKDRFGAKAIFRKLLGDTQWNELLFIYHKIQKRIKI